MPTDRWHRLDEIFTETLTQPASLRADFLARRCGDDESMRAELASLLAAEAQSGEFLSTPALDVFARQVSREGWRVQPGDRIAAYTVVERLGAGGMGEVWRARDERLGRDVAIKLLLPHPSDARERVSAFQHEAHAAGTLNHPNVLTVYDVGDRDGVPYLVTECLAGESLRARLGRGPLSLPAALDVTLQVARGLGAAHARGFVHRDLKPENIFLAADGRVKILDFGLATLHDSSPQASPPQEPSAAPMRSLVGGTAGYMAPEQVRGEVVDRRADIFALGTVLYEMLAGRQPFRGDSALATLDAVLSHEPQDLSDVNPAVPPALSRTVRQCLSKSPDDRFATVGDLASALESVMRARLPPPSVRALLRRPSVMVPVLAVMLAVVAGGWRWRVDVSRARWARTIAAPEAQRLLNHGDYAEAFLLVRQALAVVPDDPNVKQLWLDASIPAYVTTAPPGADVAIARYGTRAPVWLPLGQTPLDGVRMPRGQVRVRISKAGFQPIEGSSSVPGQRYRMDPLNAVPPGMVRVSGGRDPLRFGSVGNLDDYWIDRFEVTNRQFKAFVDQGGYRRSDYWREPFIEASRSVPWHEAIERFRDTTGQPGPATWVSGTYPAGQEDFPVGGVSWYEAAAYAAFAGKSLPTMYHWYRAAALGRFADILTTSNFSGKGPAPVGSYDGIGPFGTYDMAGNVKEWCSNETDGGRFLLGGAWNEPRYMFADYDARGPFERAPGYGFRLAEYDKPLPPSVTAHVQIEGLSHDLQERTPVADNIFAVYARQFAYDRTPLHAVVESTEQSETWLRHIVVVDAAYGGERMRVHLFLPKKGSPPYQAVVFFPGADAFHLRSSREMALSWGNSIIASGRAFVYPVYKGTYERALPDEIGANAERELRVAWSRDLGRAIDYLETRPDIDSARVAFYGVSSGADAGVILSALEPRLKTSVLQSVGVWDALVPEMDTLNYAPRVRAANADTERTVRLRDSLRDGATSAVRPARHSSRAEAAQGIRDRTCAADGRRGRGDSPVARPLSWRGRPPGARIGPSATACREPLNTRNARADNVQVVAARLRYQSTVRSQTFLERHDRLVAQDFLREPKVGQRIAHISSARPGVLGLDVCANQPPHRLEERVERDAGAGGHVDDAAAGTGGLTGAQHAVDDVGDVREVAALLAIAVDRWRPVLEERHGEQRNDAGVGRRRILPRTEDVEVPDRDGLEPVERREHLQVLLPHHLLQRIGRERTGRHVLVLRRRHGVAVGRRRTGKDDAANAGVARGDEDVQRRVDVGAVRCDRIRDRAWHGRKRRLVQHEVGTGDRLAREIEVGQIALEKLHAGHMIEIASLARDQRVGHPHVVAAPDKFFREMRADESSAARDKVLSHVSLGVPPLMKKRRRSGP